MGPITYSTLLIIVFISGAYLFNYLETTKWSISKGLKNLDKGMKDLLKIRVFSLKKEKKEPLTIGLNEKMTSEKNINASNDEDLRIYVHEY